jgi:ribonuclease R
MAEEDLQQAVLAHVMAPGYRPVKSRKIARDLGLDEEGARRLKKAVKALIKLGKLGYGGGHAVVPPGIGDLQRVTGVFRRVADGYGFVRPSTTGKGQDRSADIYIPAKRAADAASGDTVLVRLRGKPGSRRGLGPAGEILEVLERETHRFVGTYFERAGASLVQVDGKIFSQPVLVGDAVSRRARLDDKVVIEMVRFPSHFHDGEGVIVEVLGARNSPGVDTMSIIHEFGLPGDFEEEVLAETREVAAAFDESIPSDRVDLTDLTVVTIDPVDARDFDDAISLARTSEGNWRLGVHIADVSHFVAEKTLLDREAHDRATSVYLPDRVIPMLPEIISNNLASLQPGCVRYTRTLFIEFTNEGMPIDVESVSAAIRSDRRFHYEEVDEFLADRRSWKKKLTPGVHKLLADMHTLAMILRRRRFERGSLELSMPEVKIDLDPEGRVAGAHLVKSTESHQIIEEFMLAANEAVANLLHEKGHEFLRRVHESPDPRKLKMLREFVRELGLKVGSLEGRFELQRLLDAVTGRPEQHAVNYALLRSLQRAVYSPLPVGHFALASDCYCHFTSPIRRYPDLTIHRLLRLLEGKREPVLKGGQLLALGEHCSDREQRAEQAERELVQVKLLNFLSTRIGKEMDGVVTGVQDYGLFVQGSELPAEGLIHVASLADDYYHFDASAHTLSGRRRGNAFRLGDCLRVAVAHVDVDRRELDFRLVGRRKSRPVSPSGAEGRNGGGRKSSSSPRTSKGRRTKGAAGSSAKKNKKPRSKKRAAAAKRAANKTSRKSKKKHRPRRGK